jgi:hypothetical protein
MIEPRTAHAHRHQPGDSGMLPPDDERRELPLYYARQVVTPVELTLEQEYFRALQRRHNRYLHGWGVVTGARVCRVTRRAVDPQASDPDALAPTHVSILPGYLLDPCGNEIVIERPQLVDVLGTGRLGVADDPAVEPDDPWCADIPVDRDDGPVYLAVRYRRVPTRQVRVPPVGCGCDRGQCQYSRLRDHFEVGVLGACPPSHLSSEADAEPASGEATEVVTFSVAGNTLTLPPFALTAEDPGPWVVLAEIQLAGGEIAAIDPCSCRRIVPSLAQVDGRCT